VPHSWFASLPAFPVARSTRSSRGVLGAGGGGRAPEALRPGPRPGVQRLGWPVGRPRRSTRRRSLDAGGGECPAALIVQEVDDGGAGSAPSCCINPITSMMIRLSIINPSRKRSNVQASTETLRLVAGTPKKSPA
jgi:hypothetical protein